MRKLPSGRWQVRVLDRGTGRHLSVGTYPTKADANVALARAVADESRGSRLRHDAGRVTVREYATEWIDRHPSLGPRTEERYRALLRHHIVPHLGEAKLVDLTTAMIRRWHSTLAKSSPPTAAKAYRLVRAVLNTAAADEVIAVNPCRVKGAGVEHAAERPMATVAEVQALAEAVPRRYGMLVLMAAWVGLRLGELAALTRGDIDLDSATVTVSKNRQRLDNGTSVVLRPKSAAGRRTVSIPPPLLPQLREHFEEYVATGRDALVFSGEKGAPLDRSHWNRRWHAAREAIGRPDLRFHDLRHVGNTLAAATGASTRELMARMGHSSPRAALIYQHATLERDRAIAAALGDLLTASIGSSAVSGAD